MRFMELPAGFGIPDDASGAEWLRGRDGTKAHAPLEEAFPSALTDFVRVLHPGYRRLHGESLSWREALGSRGHELTAGSSWFRDIGGWTDEEFAIPETNSLPQPEATVVASIVAAHTEAPQDCWFQWSPVGGLPFETGTPLVRVRGLDRWRVRRAGIKRSHEVLRMLRSIPSLDGGALVQGPLTSLIETAPTPVPALWWPADHAWLVSTGVDAVSTYIAGTPACIDAIASEPRLESLRLTGTDTIVV